jgi:hypothetical protein
MEKLFNINDVNMIELQLQTLKFPYVHVQHSTLGGSENVSILLTISLSPKHEWNNGILQNSKYAKIHIHNNGLTEQFSGYQLKLRKFTAKNVAEIIKKINDIKVK